MRFRAIVITLTILGGTSAIPSSQNGQDKGVIGAGTDNDKQFAQFQIDVKQVDAQHSEAFVASEKAQKDKLGMPTSIDDSNTAVLDASDAKSTDAKVRLGRDQPDAAVGKHTGGLDTVLAGLAGMIREQGKRISKQQEQINKQNEESIAVQASRSEMKRELDDMKRRVATVLAQHARSTQESGEEGVALHISKNVSTDLLVAQQKANDFFANKHNDHRLAAIKARRPAMFASLERKLRKRVAEFPQLMEVKEEWPEVTKKFIRHFRAVHGKDPSSILLGKVNEMARGMAAGEFPAEDVDAEDVDAEDDLQAQEQGEYHAASHDDLDHDEERQGELSVSTSDSSTVSTSNSSLQLMEATSWKECDELPVPEDCSTARLYDVTALQQQLNTNNPTVQQILANNIMSKVACTKFDGIPVGCLLSNCNAQRTLAFTYDPQHGQDIPWPLRSPAQWDTMGSGEKSKQWGGYRNAVCPYNLFPASQSLETTCLTYLQLRLNPPQYQIDGTGKSVMSSSCSGAKMDRCLAVNNYQREWAHDSWYGRHHKCNKNDWACTGKCDGWRFFAVNGGVKNTVSPEKCAEKCFAEPDCNAFSYSQTHEKCLLAKKTYAAESSCYTSTHMFGAGGLHDSNEPGSTSYYHIVKEQTTVHPSTAEYFYAHHKIDQCFFGTGLKSSVLGEKVEDEFARCANYVIDRMKTGGPEGTDCAKNRCRPGGALGHLAACNNAYCDAYAPGGSYRSRCTAAKGTAARGWADNECLATCMDTCSAGQGGHIFNPDDRLLMLEAKGYAYNTAECYASIIAEGFKNKGNQWKGVVKDCRSLGPWNSGKEEDSFELPTKANPSKITANDWRKDYQPISGDAYTAMRLSAHARAGKHVSARLKKQGNCVWFGSQHKLQRMLHYKVDLRSYDAGTATLVASHGGTQVKLGNALATSCAVAASNDRALKTKHDEIEYAMMVAEIIYTVVSFILAILEATLAFIPIFGDALSAGVSIISAVGDFIYSMITIVSDNMQFTFDELQTHPTDLATNAMKRADANADTIAKCRAAGTSISLPTARTSTTRYSYWHQGHCAGGWLGARSVTDIDGCADQCAETSTCGYFIFDDSNANCHLYSLAAGCPNDGKYLSYKAYKLMAF